MIECLRKWLITLLTPKPKPQVVSPPIGDYTNPGEIDIELAVMWRGVTTHRFRLKVRNGQVIMKDPNGTNTACGQGSTMTICLPDRLVEAGVLAKLADIDMAEVVEALD